MLKEYERTERAMGTDASVALVCEDETLAQSLLEKALHTIHEYEKRFSRFMPQSELSLLNEQKSMQVSEEFIAVTEEALHLFHITKGVFNPLIQISRLGYITSFADLEEDIALKNEGEYDIDFSTIVIEKDTRWVRLQKGQKLDFGGFLKGYLAEKIARDLMSNSGVQGAIVNIGGDIHTRGVDVEHKPFVFQIFNPYSPDAHIPVTLTDESLATSGTYKRKWHADGIETHHILDATGEKNPETDLVSASVIHTNGGRAESYAKVFLSLGETEALTLLGEEKLHYVLITKDGTVAQNTT